MKKVILSLAIVIASLTGKAQLAPGATPVPAPEAAPNPNAAEIKFEKEVHDYGTMKQGGDGSCEFKFKNTGKEPLVITNAQGSCGCTVPSWPKEPIKPGETNVIKVHYDTKRVGPISKSVTITHNGKNSPTVIRITGKVEATPPQEEFGKKVDNGAGVPFEKAAGGF